MDPRLRQQQQAQAQKTEAPASQQKSQRSTQLDVNGAPANKQDANQSKQRVAEGPVKRNPNLQENEADCFQPRFQLSYGLPEIPIRPKLFKYRLDTKNTTKYEFSTVELNQEHQILVDYNMGVRVDLIDKSVYGTVTSERQNKMAEDQQLLCERDKFLLSDKESLPQIQQPKLSKLHSQQKSQIEQFQTKQDIFEEAFEDQDQEMVYSGTGVKGEGNRKKAVEQIVRTFERVKQYSVGVQKPGNSSVTAVSITEILPSALASIAAQFSVVLNDDDLGKKVNSVSEFSNGLMLHVYDDAQGEQRKAMYAGLDQQQIDEQLQQQILGKRTRLERKFKVIQHQHVRDYTFNQVKGGTKGEKCDYVLVKNGKSLNYIPLVSKIKLNKKRQIQVERVDDGEPLVKDQVKHIVIAPRGLAAEDRYIMMNQISSLGLTEAAIPEKSILFPNKDDVKQIEIAAAQKLKALFKVTETNLEKISRILGQSSKSQDQQMEGQNSQDNLIEEVSDSEQEDQPEPERNAKSESVVSEDDIF